MILRCWEDIFCKGPLKTLANYRLVRLERGRRRKIAPKTVHEQIGMKDW
jgi:hypothetical protein